MRIRYLVAYKWRQFQFSAFSALFAVASSFVLESAFTRRARACCGRSVLIRGKKQAPSGVGRIAGRDWNQEATAGRWQADWKSIWPVAMRLWLVCRQQIL